MDEDGEPKVFWTKEPVDDMMNNNLSSFLRRLSRDMPTYSHRLAMHKETTDTLRSAKKESLPSNTTATLAIMLQDLEEARRSSPRKTVKTSFDKDELSQGLKEEAEHTPDLAMRKKITKDHLKEHPQYYSKLKKCMKTSSCTEQDPNIPESFDNRQKPIEVKKMKEKKAFINGFVKAACQAGLTQGEAVDVFKLAASQIELNQFAPMFRRQLEPGELDEVAQAKQKIMPKIFTSYADPIHADMSSPGVSAIPPGLLGAGAGGLAGGILGGEDNKGITALLGALLGGGAGGLYGYKTREAKNKTLEEAMRKLPVGATRDDYERDPRVQSDLSRQALLSQLQRSQLGSQALLSQLGSRLAPTPSW